jgi:hypothetical protein
MMMLAFSPLAQHHHVHPERAHQISNITAKAKTWRAAAHARFARDAPGASKPLLGVHGNCARVRGELSAASMRPCLTMAASLPSQGAPRSAT